MTAAATVSSLTTAGTNSLSGGLNGWIDIVGNRYSKAAFHPKGPTVDQGAAAGKTTEQRLLCLSTDKDTEQISWAEIPNGMYGADTQILLVSGCIPGKQTERIRFMMGRSVTRGLANVNNQDH